MEKEFVYPNLHIVLVHYPLALLVCGTLIEIFGFLWRNHSVRGAARWMILLGALSGIPTIYSGIYALHDVAHSGALSDVQRQLLNDHLRLESIAVILAVLVCVIWIGSSDWLRTRLHPALLAVLTVSVFVMVAGAYQSGVAVFRHGTAVAKVSEIPATQTSATMPSTSPTTVPTSSPANSLEFNFEKIEYYAPPMQVHMILAGVAVAIAMGTLGLSIRKITQKLPPTQVDHIAAALGAPPSLSGAESADSMAVPQDFNAPVVPASRFWMLTSLVVILTAGVGYFMLATASKTWSASDLWNGIIKDNLRQMMHVITGGSLVVLPIFMAMLARWAPRQKILLALFTLILLAAVLLQLWLGILLLYDGRIGPWNAFGTGG